MADMTVQELIKAALRSIGAIATGETPTDAEMTEGLEALQIMLRQWSAKRRMIYYTDIVTHSLTAGTTSYTIGSGADIATTRPTRITAAYVRSGNVDYPIKIIDSTEYAAVSVKDQGGDNPAYIWYNPTYTTGTIYLWPPGGGEMYMHCLFPLSDPSTLTTSVTFPPEYDAAIKFNLALHLAPEYGREPSMLVFKHAEDALLDIVNINASLAIQRAGLELIGLTRRWNIDVGV